MFPCGSCACEGGFGLPSERWSHSIGASLMRGVRILYGNGGIAHFELFTCVDGPGRGRKDQTSAEYAPPGSSQCPCTVQTRPRSHRGSESDSCIKGTANRTRADPGSVSDLEYADGRGASTEGHQVCRATAKIINHERTVNRKNWIVLRNVSCNATTMYRMTSQD